MIFAFGGPFLLNLAHLDLMFADRDPTLGPSWAVLGPSWARLGPILGLSWAILGRLGAILGPSWGHVGPSLPRLEGFLRHPLPSRSHFPRLSAVLDASGVILEPFVVYFAPSWGSFWPILEPRLAPLGLSFAHLRAYVRVSSSISSAAHRKY